MKVFILANVYISIFLNITEYMLKYKTTVFIATPFLTKHDLRIFFKDDINIDHYRVLCARKKIKNSLHI